MSPIHTFTPPAEPRFEEALETPPYLQPVEMSDERTVATVTTNVWTIHRAHRMKALGQCASLLTLLVAVPVIQTIWSVGAGEGLRAAIAGCLAGFYLIPAAIKNWRG